MLTRCDCKDYKSQFGALPIVFALKCVGIFDSHSMRHKSDVKSANTIQDLSREMLPNSAFYQSKLIRGKGS